MFAFTFEHSVSRIRLHIFLLTKSENERHPLTAEPQLNQINSVMSNHCTSGFVVTGLASC